MLKFFLVSILAYLIYSKIKRFLFGNTQKRRTQYNRSYQSYNSSNTYQKQRSTGKISIHRQGKQSSNNTTNFKGGEYVDYEEID